MSEGSDIVKPTSSASASNNILEDSSIRKVLEEKSKDII